MIGRANINSLQPWTFLSLVAFTIGSIPYAHAGRGDPDPGCSTAQSDPGVPIRAFVSDGISPLKEAYLKTDFKLDPLSSNLAVLENETDAPNKRKTFTFLTRGNAASQTLLKYQQGSLLDPNSPFNLIWRNGVAHILNSQIDELNTQKGLLLPTAINLNLADIQKLSTNDLATRIRTSFPATEKTGNPRDYVMMASYLKLTSVTDLASFNGATDDMKNVLTTAEKIRLAQAVGGAANDRYDFQRAGASGPNKLGPDGRPLPGITSQFGKSVPFVSIISNLRTGNPLGICRDIAPAQAKVLEGLGFKNVYVFGYNDGPNHVAVIAQNPDNPKEILHFNYAGLERGDLKQGSRSLTRGEDYSTRYDIFTPDGKSVATIPSELGALMVEGEGGNIKNLDPFLYRAQGSIAKLSMDGKHSQVPVFVGRTSSGVDVVGIGNTIQFGNPEKNTVSVTNTTGLAYQNKNAAVYSDQKSTFDALHLNVTTAVDVNGHWHTLKKDDKGTLEGRVVSTTVLHGDGTLSGLKKAVVEPGASGSLTSEVGAEAKFQSADESTKIKARLATQGALGTKSVSGIFPLKVYRNITYANVSGEQVILPEKLEATFNTAVGLREFGPQILVQGGVNLPQSGVKASAGYQGALKKDAFTIAPGMEREVFMDVEKNFKNSVVLTASYEQPLGFSVGPPAVQVGAKGSLSEILKKKKRPKKTPTD